MLEATEVRSEETRWRLRTSALFGDSPPELAIEDLRRRLESDERLGLSNGGASVTIVTPGRLQFRGGRTWGADARAEGGRETILARSLRAAIRLSDRMGLSPEAPRRGAKTPRNPHHRRLCRLAYLAPDIQAAIIAGRHPQSLTVAALTDLAFPACWADQRARLGFGDHVLRGPA